VYLRYNEATLKESNYLDIVQDHHRMINKVAFFNTDKSNPIAVVKKPEKII
jgi:hypothetical protein